MNKMFYIEKQEVYEYVYNSDSNKKIKWDINKAKEAINSGTHELAEVPYDQLQLIAETYDFNEEKVGLADCSIPGIVACVLEPRQAEGYCYIIIDGIHRAVKAYRTGQKFYCYGLTDEENRSSVLESSPETIL